MFIRRKRTTAAVLAFALMTYAASGQLGTYLGYIEEFDYFDSAGVEIHYSDQGVGDAVILLHGYGMNSDITWRNSGIVDSMMENGLRPITMDFRGHGLSEKPMEASAYGREMARDVVRLMNHLGIDKAHIVGNSLGGMVAQRVLVMYPERVQSLTSCGMGLADRNSQRMDTWRLLVESLRDDGSFRPLVHALLPENRRPPSIVLDAADTYIGTIMNDREALLAMTLGMPDICSTIKDFAGCPVPVLNIMGGYDPLIADVEPLAAALSDHQLHIVEGVNHFTLMGQSETQAALVDFIIDHPVLTAPAIGS